MRTCSHCVRVCVRDAVAQSDRYSVERRLAHTEMRQLSRPCPFNPGWQGAASHMAWASCIWSRAGRGKTGITTSRARVCVSSRCTLMAHITANHLIECWFIFIHLCGPGLMPFLFSPLVSSPQLIPQFLFLTLGITGATFYLIRLARGPHVV